MMRLRRKTKDDMLVFVFHPAEHNFPQFGLDLAWIWIDRQYLPKMLLADSARMSRFEADMSRLYGLDRLSHNS